MFRAAKASELIIRLDYSGVARYSDRHQLEFLLVALVRLCRSLTGLALVPTRVTICHGRSESVRDYNAFFGCPTEFQAERDSVVFEDQYRGLPVVSADPHLSEILVRYCEETLSSRRKAMSSFRIRVENAIAPLLPHGKPKASTIAHELNASQRTLARRLQRNKRASRQSWTKCAANLPSATLRTPNFRSLRSLGCSASKRWRPSRTRSADGREKCPRWRVVSKQCRLPPEAPERSEITQH
jgi:Arabinose-binding domain of AraC transcription regulator, N-term